MDLIILIIILMLDQEPEKMKVWFVFYEAGVVIHTSKEKKNGVYF